MTVVVVLTDCPAKLRGDMSKWMLEINTGVYFGNMSARVRDGLWKRIVENIGHGHATMVFGAPGEQHMDFRTHNAYWQAVDYDGIKLLLRPAARSTDQNDSGHFSKAALYRTIEKQTQQRSRLKNPFAKYYAESYAVVDLETTGLDPVQDSIIEIGALLVEDGVKVAEYYTMVKINGIIPEEIVRLTGITDDTLQKEGVSQSEAIAILRRFTDGLPIICHNAGFDKQFLDKACDALGEDAFSNRMIDTAEFAKALLPNAKNYRLETVAKYLLVPAPTMHRALPDCQITYGIYNKLKEFSLKKNEK